MRRSMRGHFTSLFNKGKSDISSLCRSVDRCWSSTRKIPRSLRANQLGILALLQAPPSGNRP
jgi:hypothetical protein